MESINTGKFYAHILTVHSINVMKTKLMWPSIVLVRTKQTSACMQAQVIPFKGLGEKL